jgi:hypothetical protein
MQKSNKCGTAIVKKTALLKQKERLEQQEVQLEEVRKGELYKSLQEGLSQHHKTVDAKNFEDLFEKVRTDFAISKCSC